MSKKDWVGNMNSIYVTLGASNHTDKDREENDYYATDPIAMTMLLGRETFSHNVWEPCVGGGHLARVLEQSGYDVRCSDLVDRGYPNTQVVDFLSIHQNKDNRDIITNPPYKYAQEFVEHALDLLEDGGKCAMFLKIQFLEGQERLKLFSANPPKYVYVFSKRVNCAMNGDFDKYPSSAMAFAWFVWYKGFKGDTIIRWIDDNKEEEQNKKKKLW